MPKAISFTDQIRKCIDASGMTRYAISTATGIDQATLSRFMHRKGGLSMQGLDAVAKTIGMRAVMVTRG